MYPLCAQPVTPCLPSALQAFHGLAVTLVYKYADAIVKNFANSSASASRFSASLHPPTTPDPALRGPCDGAARVNRPTGLTRPPPPPQVMAILVIVSVYFFNLNASLTSW